MILYRGSRQRPYAPLAGVEVCRLTGSAIEVEVFAPIPGEPRSPGTPAYAFLGTISFFGSISAMAMMPITGSSVN